MYIIMPLIFALGILAIALEDKLKINKAASALLTSLLLWIVYISLAPGLLGSGTNEVFNTFLAENPNIASLPTHQQYLRFIVDNQIVEHLGDVSSTLFFVMSTMVIIELIDRHGGFLLITNNIQTENKRRLLWIVSFIAFIISALLDNLATAIVMIAMLRKLIPHSRERWIYSSMIVIAANAGGAWSPIGDVTTILLWNHGNITPLHQISHLFIPSFVCMFVSLLIVSRFFGKNDRWDRASMGIIYNTERSPKLPPVGLRGRVVMLAIGILSLALVPVFNYVTGLPPFMGVLFGMVVLWIYTDLLYGHRYEDVEEKQKYRVARVFSKIDMSTILFFLGILMSVAALQSAGQLNQISEFLNTNVKSPLLISFAIGTISSVLDNVALVAATMGMYPIVDIATASAEQIQYYAVNGEFWTFLAYCAVTGGSIFIIGSATGVTIMGLEKISFSYYMKRFTLVALTGYICGGLTYYLLSLI